MDEGGARARFNISRLAIRYPIVTYVVWLAVVIGGVVAFLSLKYTLLPDIAFPVVVVTATNDEPTAQRTERDLTIPLEARLAHVGENAIRSSTYAGRTEISLAYDVGASLDERERVVRDALVGLGSTVPSGTKLKITPVDLNESTVVTYAVTVDSASFLQVQGILRGYAQPAFAGIPGVRRVDVLGDDPKGLTAARFNGKRAIEVRVVKKASANTLDVADACESVRSRIATFAGLELVTGESQAPYIREASHATTDALGLAMALSVLVILPFLRDWRATVISAVAIPVSLAGTAIAMALLHFNLETITLLALALVIGVVVDDAIVDVENISRHIDRGASPMKAAIEATDEIGLTVTAATFTIVAVFLPIGLMTGTLGLFFKPFGITASAAVLTSLLVARTLSPTIAAEWLKRRDTKDTPPAQLFGWYRGILAWSLRRPRTVLIAAAVSFVAGLAIVPLIPKGFIPHLDRGDFLVTVTAPANAKNGVALAAAKRYERVVRQDADVADVLVTIGGRGDPTSGELYVTLKPSRSATTFDVENRVRTALPTLANIVPSVEDIPFVDTGVSKPLRVSLSAPLTTNLDVLEDAAQSVATRTAEIPGLVGVTLVGIERNDRGALTRIDHEALLRVAYIDGDTTGLPIGDATTKVADLARTMLPAGVRVGLGGESEDIARTFGQFGTTLALSVVSIVVVLALLFRGWRAPLVIACSLPLSIVGAMLALFVTRADFGIISLMGVIFLFGLVNKNAILLVDFIQQRRRAGMDRFTAVIDAAAHRLRPILMTTGATILGMLPIALGLGAGSELRAPMAVAIIGGLLTSTLLSLIVIPVAYAAVDRA